MKYVITNLNFRASATTLLFLVNLIIVASPSVPDSVDHMLLALPCAIFANIMACRVFRGVALEMMEHPSYNMESVSVDNALELEPLPPKLPAEPTKPFAIFNPRS